VIAYLETLQPEDFAGAATVELRLPRWEGKWMFAEDHLVQHAVPSFFFHLAMAYAILRHTGVDLGKRDYLGRSDLR
jgi:hypothetical protein